MRNPAGYRFAYENTLKLAIEMDTEMLTIADIDWFRLGIECRRDDPAIGVDNRALDRRTGQQRDVVGPGVNVELAVCSAHALSDNRHSTGNTIKGVVHFDGEGYREVTAFRSSAVHRRFSCRYDRRNDDRPNRHDDSRGDGNDSHGECSTAALGIFGRGDRQIRTLQVGSVNRALQC